MNRLHGEASPYLLAHATDPVPWWPWCQEAFDEATRRDVPVLVSIGYAACHWCHVMHHESFQDAETAAFLADRFVSVKVDREERPEVDAVFMAALQAMRGQGGWPLTAVADPLGRPLFAATYLPPRDGPGMPSFLRVLRAIDEAWRHRRDVLLADAERLREHLERTMAAPSTRGGETSEDQVPDPSREALDVLERAFDERHGGFGDAPKFPNHGVLRWLSSRGEPRATRMAHLTLEAIARGGIVDPLGGGPARYAVDAAWRVPHFEKMTTDAVQLLPLWAEASLAGGGVVHERAAQATFAFLETEMRLPRGTYATALDADSLDATGRSREGAFYAWTAPDFDAAVRGASAASSTLGDVDVVAFARAAFDVHDVGPFEGRNVLRAAIDADDLASRFGLAPSDVAETLRHVVAGLMAERATRARPLRDDKELTEVQGLAVRGLARAGRLLADEAMVAAARRIADATWTTMWSVGGGLARRAYGDVVGLAGTLGDHAHLGLGCLEVHHACGDVAAVHRACTLAVEIERRFASPEGGFTSSDSSADRAVAGPLAVVPRSLLDGALPADTVAAAELTWRVGRLLGDDGMTRRAVQAVVPLATVAARHPEAVGSALALLDAMRRPPAEVIVTGRDEAGGAELWAEVSLRALDGLLVLRVPDALDANDPLWPWTEGRMGGRIDDGRQAHAWPCTNRTCDRPLADPRALATWLDDHATLPSRP